MRSGTAAATLLVIVAALAASGCGEREFTAQEFVDAANGHDAELELGDQLTTTESGEPVLKISSSAPPGSDPNPQLQAGTSSGTMIVAADVDSAGAEFDRCEAAADLTCFRAANVVLRFEEMEGADRARITGAVTALQSDG
jgi:hypothetical protein